MTSWRGRLVQKLPGGIQRIIERYRHAAQVLIKLDGVYPRTCLLCNFHGRFRAFGLPPAFDAMCRRCDSLERHRLFVLMDAKFRILDGVESLLHFAPERILETKFRQRFGGYQTADLFRDDVDFQCNIEETSLAAASFDAIFVSHVLEHVDNDRKAMKELHRLLKPKGKLIAMIPIVDGWDDTYENKSITSETARFVHFGQKDHVRYYGADFGKRLEAAGFEVTAFTSTPQDCVDYGLNRGEKVFVGVRTT